MLLNTSKRSWYDSRFFLLFNAIYKNAIGNNKGIHFNLSIEKLIEIKGLLSKKKRT